MAGIHASRLLNRAASGNEGVSPVVGSILILVIMVLSIAGILVWGVPAMQGLQDHAEFQNSLTQFLQLQADVRNLRDPQNTKVTQLNVAGGSLTFDRGDRWVISVSREAAYDPFFLEGWEGSNPATVTVAGITLGAAHQATVDEVVGGTFTNRYSCSATCPANLPLGATTLDSAVVRIQIKEGTVRAEAWILHVGRITYQQSTLHERNILHFSMGAVFAQQNQAFFLEFSPAVKDPDYALNPKDESLFLRALQLTGDPVSQTGRGRHPIVFHLVDNYGPARGRPSFDPASSARIQIHGALEVAFCGYFDKQTDWVPRDDAGAATTCPVSGTAGDVNLRLEPGAERMVFDLNHAEVSTIVRAVQA